MQVKHRKGQARGPDVRQFAGTVRENENGLFVSTGGFTSDALREPEYQAIVPLKKVLFRFLLTMSRLNNHRKDKKPMFWTILERAKPK